MCQLKILATESTRRTSIGFSAHYLRPKNAEWEWGFPSAIRLSKATPDVSGSLRLLREARTSNSVAPSFETSRASAVAHKGHSWPTAEVRRYPLSRRCSGKQHMGGLLAAIDFVKPPVDAGIRRRGLISAAVRRAPAYQIDHLTGARGFAVVDRRFRISRAQAGPLDASVRSTPVAAIRRHPGRSLQP